MNQISNMVIRMKSREKYFLYFSYIANVMVTCILTMIATGIQNITNESLSSSDQEQIQSILTSVIAVSVIAIAFFQWIISMQFRSLFESRRQFNNNIRLMGAPDRGVFRVYFREMITMQPFSILAGMVLGEIVFKVLSEWLDTSIQFIAPVQLIVAAAIHFIVIGICIIYTFRKLTRSNIINEIRGVNFAKENKRNTISDIIKFILGVLLFTVSTIATLTGERGSDRQAYGWFGILISIYLLYDFMILFTHKVISKIAKKIGIRSMIFSEAISIGYLQKSKASGMMILFSSMMFLGLNMLYTNVRVCGLDTVETRVNYAGSAWFDNIHGANDVSSKIFQGLKYKTKHSGSNWYILGISADFEGTYEDIVLDHSYGGNKDEMKQGLNSSDFDGIYMPNMYITEDDIGNEILININGIDVAFHIAGAYYSNNLSHISFFVSKSYLAKSLGISENAYNILYFSDQESWKEFKTNEKCILQSFEDIKKESYEKAVSGTSLVEMVAVVIILCAVISLVNFIMISSRSDSFDVARFRGIGLSRSQVRKIYLIESLMPVVLSMIISVPASILFALIGCGMVFDIGYYQRNLIVLPMQMIMLLVIFALISLVTRMIALKKTISTDSYVEILREVKE